MHGRSMDLALNRLTGKIEDKCARCKADIMHALNRNRMLNKSFTIKRLADNIDKDCQHETTELLKPIEVSYVTLIDEKPVTNGAQFDYFTTELAINGGIIIIVNAEGEIVTSILVYAGTETSSTQRYIDGRITEYPLQSAEIKELMDDPPASSMDFDEISAVGATTYDGTLYMFKFNEPFNEP